MLKKLRYYTSISTALFFLLFSTAHSQSISVAGADWNPAITAITEAGNDYNPNTFESANNQIVISLNGLPGFFWLIGRGVSVKYNANPNWNTGLQLSVMRTGDGTVCGTCSISGGRSYINVSSAEVEFFRVNSGIFGGNITNIPVQIKLSGISATVPKDAYSGQLVFTITN